MLKERITYQENLPVNVLVSNIVEVPIHFHDDMEIALVLAGTVTLKNGFYMEELHEGDIFILNARELHSYYHAGRDNMVLILQINLDFFTRYFDHLRNSFFVADLNDSYDESIEILKTLLASIVSENLRKEHGYQHKIIENTCNLLSCLFEDFQYFALGDGKFINDTRYKGNKVLAGRLSRITDYMYQHYTDRLTLQEISETEHLSIYYLSHVIKTATGLSFQELLSFMRVEESEKLLLGTEKKIGTIAEECGFSAVRYYIKYFIKWFGLHPEEYRKKYTGQVMSRKVPENERAVEPELVMRAIRHLAGSAYNAGESDKDVECTTIELDWGSIPNSGRLDTARFEFLLEYRKYDGNGLGSTAERENSCDFYQDSLIEMIRMFRRARENRGLVSGYYLLSDSEAIPTDQTNDHRDGGDLLQGKSGLLTAGQIPKPSWYASLMLKQMTGEMISQGDNYLVTRPTRRGKERPDRISILLYNGVPQAYTLPTGKTRNEVVEAVRRFGQKAEFDIKIVAMAGNYRVSRYQINGENSIMEHLEKLQFPKTLNEFNAELLRWNLTPKTDQSLITVSDSFGLQAYLKGFSAELIVIQVSDEPIHEAPRE